MSAPDPDLSDILFPSASRSISTFLRTNARSKLTLRSRLHSISADASFVLSVADLSGLPLVANERCGSWYVPPHRKHAGVYFKSTDGHHGQWAFSLRRLNVGLLKVVNEYGGAVIVDSTRRGKTVPDALAKTVPVWAEVWNRLLFPSREGEMRLSLDVVGESEAAQIEARIEGWVAELDALGIGKDIKLERPIRPLWVTQTTLYRLASELEEARQLGTYPLVLCTASGSDARDITHEGYDYVQGAADDEEAWSCGLKPITFWTNKNRLLDCDDDELPELVAELVGSDTARQSGRLSTMIKPTSTISIGQTCQRDEDWDVVIDLRLDQVPEQRGPTSRVTIGIPLETGKLGSRTLRRVLPDILEKTMTLLAKKPDSRMIVVCETGKDHSIGVALAILCLHVDDDGRMLVQSRNTGINKDYIKKRLGWIMVCIPDANPSRATLQSVNAVLLGRIWIETLRPSSDIVKTKVQEADLCADSRRG